MLHIPVLLLVLLTAIPSVAEACRCLPLPWFDLLAYDQNSMVVEVEVLEALEFPEEKRPISGSLQMDSLNKEKLLPRPVPPKRRDYVDFRIKVLTDFKGNAAWITRLRATNKNTSCYGGPQVGQRYLIYANGLETQEGFQALVITSACQRKISASESRFAKEKEILRFSFC